MLIPVLNPAGDVTQIYGRKINDDHLRPGTPVHLYLPGPHRGVWNEQALEVSKEIILCEALIDALTFWCAGYRNVTASYGVNGFTDDHRAAFQKHATQRVLIAYDRDEAGEKAALALAGELMGMGIECFRILFPKGMDANEYALKVGPAAKSSGHPPEHGAVAGQGEAARSNGDRAGDRAPSPDARIAQLMNNIRAGHNRRRKQPNSQLKKSYDPSQSYGKESRNREPVLPLAAEPQTQSREAVPLPHAAHRRASEVPIEIGARGDRDHAGRPALPRARTREEHQLRAAENESAGFGNRTGRRLPRGHARSLLGAAAHGVPRSRRPIETGREGRSHPARSRTRAA